MKRFLVKLSDLLSSFQCSVVLLMLYALVLGIATFIEKYFGTNTAKELVYCSPTVFFVQLLLVINFFCFSLKKHYFKLNRISFVFIHLALILILVGALTTHVLGKEGYIELYEGETTEVMLVQNDQKTVTEPLPFQIKLDDFVLTRYPGSNSPSSYESWVTVFNQGGQRKEHIYMNNVLNVDGYRLFQSSYTQDEAGSILLVSHDVYGKNITYLGYFMLFGALIYSLFERNGRLRILYAQLKKVRVRDLSAVLFFLPLFPLQASPHAGLDIMESLSVPSAHAHRFGELPIQGSNGRTMPVNTFSSEILRKLHKSAKIANLDSDQFLLSLLVMPDVWMKVPLFAFDDKELAKEHHLSTPYCSYWEMFDDQHHYKFQDELKRIYGLARSDRNRRDEAILKLDEKLNIFYSLVQRQGLKIFPLEGDKNHRWFSPGDDLSSFSGQDSMFVSKIFDWYLEEVAQSIHTNQWSQPDKILGMIGVYQQSKSSGLNIQRSKIDTEIIYNKLNLFNKCKLAYLILGALLLLIAVLELLFDRSYRIINILVPLIFIAFTVQVAGIALRWYIGGHAPWSNSYETMVYVSFAVMIAGLVFFKKNLIVFALATIFSGVILFVSELSWMDPQITTLVPVLKSPWLTFHVAVIVAAYGFFLLSTLIGITNLILMILSGRSPSGSLAIKTHELSIINEMSLNVGLVLMTIGTFLGAIWANESWGRYWGWDPKETWALVTVLVYAMVTHIHILHFKLKEWWLNVLSVLSISTVLMTFLGVNYFLSGLHSYGENHQLSHLFLWLILASFIVVCLIVMSYIMISRKGHVFKSCFE